MTDLSLMLSIPASSMMFNEPSSGAELSMAGELICHPPALWACSKFSDMSNCLVLLYPNQPANAGSSLKCFLFI